VGRPRAPLIKQRSRQRNASGCREEGS
jgi:hypothetical protein